MEGEGARGMYRGGREADNGVLECKSFPSYVFKDACFPQECGDRIRIKTFSSDIKLPVGRMVFLIYFSS